MDFKTVFPTELTASYGYNVLNDGIKVSQYWGSKAVLAGYTTKILSSSINQRNNTGFYTNSLYFLYNISHHS